LGQQHTANSIDRQQQRGARKICKLPTGKAKMADSRRGVWQVAGGKWQVACSERDAVPVKSTREHT